MTEQKRRVGAVTTAAAAGSGAGYAAAKIIVWALSLASIEAAEIVEPLGLVLTVGGAVLGGYLKRPVPRRDTGKHVAE